MILLSSSYRLPWQNSLCTRESSRYRHPVHPTASEPNTLSGSDDLLDAPLYSTSDFPRHKLVFPSFFSLPFPTERKVVLWVFHDSVKAFLGYVSIFLRGLHSTMLFYRSVRKKRSGSYDLPSNDMVVIRVTTARKSANHFSTRERCCLLSYLSS